MIKKKKLVYLLALCLLGAGELAAQGGSKGRELRFKGRHTLVNDVEDLAVTPNRRVALVRGEEATLTPRQREDYEARAQALARGLRDDAG